MALVAITEQCSRSPILPDDLLMEILLLLPANTLMRLKSVCKSWRTLITSPQFTNNHFHRSISNPAITVHRLIQNPSSPFTLFSLAIPNILGSCNGLFCIVNYHLGTIRLFNPLTRLASKQVPLLETYHLTYHGLGYDHVNDKFKFLAVGRVPGRLSMVTRVCTFGTPTSWKTIPDHGYDDFLSFGNEEYNFSAKFVSGTATLNWVGHDPVTHNRMICSFDLANEAFGCLPLPAVNHDKIRPPVLGVLRNALSLCYFDFELIGWNVWMMKEYRVQHSWTKLAMISTSQVESPTLNSLTLQPLYLSKDGILVLQEFQFDFKVLLVSCNSSRDCRLYGHYHDAMARLCIYHEILVPPSYYGEGFVRLL